MIMGDLKKKKNIYIYIYIEREREREREIQFMVFNYDVCVINYQIKTLINFWCRGD